MNKHILNPKNQILKLYDDFILETSKIEKEILRTKIKTIAATYPEKDAICYQILGLIDYESDDWKKHIDNTIQNFKKAVELNPENFLAQLYIAHCYHDTGNLQLALENYRLVHQQKLKELQVWRYVKLIEQIGYCEYKLGNKAIGELHFAEVLQWYKQLPEVDRAVPSELMECLPKNHWIVIEMKKIESYLDS